MAKRQIRWRWIALLALVSGSTSNAQQSGGDFGITRQVLASGGVHASGGNYSAVSTIAQPIASGAQSGGDFVVRGGFHVPNDASASADALFKNGFEN